MRTPVSNPAKKPDTATVAGAFEHDAAPRGRITQPPASPRLGDAIAFLRGFVANPREIASVIPSSRFLEARIARAADLGQARCVVELGPGTGGTTRALLRAMSPSARLLAVELNPGFCDHLRARLGDPRLAVQAGSAEELVAHLAQWRLPPPDVVISGIPFSTMPPDVARRIAAAIRKALAPGGRFVAYQFRPEVAGYATPHLGEPLTAFEWRNIPPMRVFRWTRSAD
jgi:phospholipid N-methyltransferase